MSLMMSDATLQVTTAPPAVVARDTIGSFASGGRSDADPRQRVSNVVERGAQVGTEMKLDVGGRRAFVDGRSHLLDAGDGRDRILDLARDLGLHLRRRHAGVGDGHDDGRELDVRPILDAELRKAQKTGQVVSPMNIMITGTGLRIDQVTKFMSHPPQAS